jgi:hypothetical protein
MNKLYQPIKQEKASARLIVRLWYGFCEETYGSDGVASIIHAPYSGTHEQLPAVSDRLQFFGQNWIFGR